jgi:anti-sigma factor ChrR (cupin superfamily)
MAGNGKSGPTIVDLEALDYVDHTDVDAEVSDLDFDGCEARIVSYPAGSKIPRHKHSGQTLTVVLSGRTEGPDGKELVPGMLYKCGGIEYGPWAVLEDTRLLLLQKPGTDFVLSE